MARIACRINALQGGDVYRVNDLAKTAKRWQPATVSKYVSSGKFGQGTLAPRVGDVRLRGEKINGDAMTLVGWSDAAFGASPVWENADWDTLSA